MQNMARLMIDASRASVARESNTASAAQKNAFCEIALWLSNVCQTIKCTQALTNASRPHRTINIRGLIFFRAFSVHSMMIMTRVAPPKDSKKPIAANVAAAFEINLPRVCRLIFKRD